jgi:16S rRNA (cytosine967-C5)-methyltransferase
LADADLTARALAWEVLCRVDETDAFADVLLGHRLERSTLERRDQGFATQLVYGTLAWRGYLDCAITSFAGRPADSLEAPIRALLQLSLFQILLLDRVPAYAAVNSAVELAKGHRGGRASGLVNAVLRRAARESAAGVVLPPRTELAAHLAARWSHPQWLVERWLVEMGGAATEALLEANNRPAPTVLRVSRRRSSRDRCLADLRSRGQTVEAGAVAPDAIHFSGGSAVALQEFAAGVVSLQSEASQLVTLLLDPRPGETILDACAGSGGKSTYIAELQQDQGRVLAIDLHGHSLGRMRVEAARLGLGSISPLRADATRAPFRPEARFDRILLDAPCSGLGTLRQHPEIRWRRAPRDIAAAGRRQGLLLAALLDLLRPGGVLVYAVCSVLRAENEDVVAAALGGRDDIARESAAECLPSEARHLVDEHGALRTLPHRGGLDGFYAVRLRRR